MGLDLVEISMQIEERFGVPFESEDYESVVTSGDVRVGDVFDLVVKKLAALEAGKRDIGLNRALCLDMQADISEVTGAPSSDIRLNTDLRELFPRSTRAALWETFQTHSQYRIPELHYPRWVSVAGVAGVPLIVLLEQLPLWQIPFIPQVLLVLLGVAMLIETTLRLSRLMKPFRSRFPDGMRTVKQLCKAVLKRNHRSLAIRDVYQPDANAVWPGFRDLLAETLCVEPEKITRESRLFADLGAD